MEDQLPETQDPGLEEGDEDRRPGRLGADCLGGREGVQEPSIQGQGANEEDYRVWGQIRLKMGLGPWQ